MPFQVSSLILTYFFIENVNVIYSMTAYFLYICPMSVFFQYHCHGYRTFHYTDESWSPKPPVWVASAFSFKQRSLRILWTKSLNKALLISLEITPRSRAPGVQGRTLCFSWVTEHLERTTGPLSHFPVCISLHVVWPPFPQSVPVFRLCC